MNQLPVVVIVGRPNVGKSTLFNALTRTRDALVADQPGVTRDRIYGTADLGERTIVLVDTGGLVDDPDAISRQSARQVEQAIDEADSILFLIDARAGLNAHDMEIGARLRARNKPVVVVLNKTDGLDVDQALAETAELSMGAMVPVSAEHRRGIGSLATALVETLPEPVADLDDSGDTDAVKLALIGRPNTGKSTLLNRLAGEERALTLDMPGTTRDPVHAEIRRDGRAWRLVDTAGIRRRSRVREAVEKFSVIKALQAIEKSDLVILLTDAREGITDQDAGLLGHILDAGRPLVIAVNKWDGLDDYQRGQIKAQLDQRLGFANFAQIVTISALHGTGMGELFAAIERAWEAASRELPTSALSRCLEQAVAAHPPPASQRFVPKLRFAHSGGILPTRIVIHGNRTRHLPDSYRRYLANRFRKTFELTGVPVQLIFKDSENPYAGRKNVLSKRQVDKRKRLRKRVKRKG